MLKIFYDKDNIAFLGNQVNAEEHSHCVLQAFLSLEGTLHLIVENESVNAKCVVVNKNAKHTFSCENKPCLSILIDPCSSFAHHLIEKMDGNFFLFDNENTEALQQNAAQLISANEKEQYLLFVNEFAKYLGIERQTNIMDERIKQLMQLLHDCTCYNHTIERFANEIALSESRLSHLFHEQVGVSLKSYILFHQLEKAFEAIFSGKSITDAAMLAGFDSPSHFAATVRKWMGMSVSSSLKNSGFLKVFI